MLWEDEYREDGLWQIVVETREALTTSISDGTLDSSDSRVQHLSDLLSELEAYRGYPDPRITPMVRKNMGTAVQAIGSGLPNIDSLFKPASGKSISRFEELARLLRAWPQRGSVTLVGLNSQIEHLKHSVDSVHRSASEQIEQIENASKDSIEKINKHQHEHSRDYENELQELRQNIEALNRSLQTTKEAVGLAEERIEKALRDQKAAFDTDQEQRSKEFAAHIEEEREAAQLAQEKAREDAETALESVRANKREADELLGAMAHRSTATDYGKWAEQQRKEARGWSLLAILLFVLGAAAFLESYFHIFTTPPQPADSESLWGEVLARLGMTGVVLAGAIYAAKEAGRHRSEERSAKARELVLTTMDPFMVNIDPEVRELIRTEAARSIFVIRDEEKSTNQNKRRERLLERLRSDKQTQEEEKS